jgi:hypothetical protein
VVLGLVVLGLVVLMGLRLLMGPLWLRGLHSQHVWGVRSHDEQVQPQALLQMPQALQALLQKLPMPQKDLLVCVA